MEDLTDKIIRSKRRRSLGLVVTKEGDLEIRVPFNTSLRSIKNFVNNNRGWIEEKIKERKDFINKYRNFVFPEKFIDGAKVIYEGEPYRLQITNCQNIKISDALYFPKNFLSQAKQYLIIWLKHQALKKIVERVDYFASITELQYKTVKITSAKGIWGSCSSRGSLIINWRLIMAPSYILDYIVVHELIHLVIKNHSKFFWSKVGEVLPDYKKREAWIKKNGDILML